MSTVRKYSVLFRYIAYILGLSCALLQTACVENLVLEEYENPEANFQICLHFPYSDGEPETRVGGTGTTPGLDYETVEQRYVNDVAVLLLYENKVINVLDEVSIDNLQGYPTRLIKMNVPILEHPVDVMILINPQHNGISRTEIEGLLNKSVTDVHDLMLFDYTKDSEGRPVIWDITKRYLPMYGLIKNQNLNKDNPYGSCDLYHCVAKMGLKVAETCTTFQMTEVYTYYMEQQGYMVSKHSPDEAIDKQYTSPDVPSTSLQTGEDNTLMYSVTNNEIFNKIFLPESDHKTIKTDGKKPLKVVVGGIFSGEGLVDSGEKCYYRIDMYDDIETPYDVIRNHSYVYIINKVDNPGTPSPDEALDNAVPALKVELQEWTPEYLRGVPDQYTLTTSESVIAFDNYMDIQPRTLDIWTDYFYGWTVDTDENGNIIDSSTGKAIEWLEVDTVAGPYNQTTTVTMNPYRINTGGTLINRFWVKAGSIRKEITVIIPQPPTANSYVVGDSEAVIDDKGTKNGDFKIIVGIKGNGADGTRPEGKDIVLMPDGEDMSPVEDAALTPATLGIIWETQAGLISLKNPTTGEYATGKTRVPYNATTNTLDFKTTITDDTKIGTVTGGNALIGAFDEDGKVIWSWHIWVCPEMYDPSTGQIIEDKFLQDWTISGYKFMDRNLGALSNEPIYTKSVKNSVASMGLQYQWGRKDPFIGPAYSNDVFTGTGLLPVVHYYEEWGVNGKIGASPSNLPSEMPSANRTIDYTIEHPTQLVYWNHADGNPTSVVSIDDIGAYLWGTDKGFVADSKELGSKTIYDPCPVGYRVPPVDAYVFQTVYPQFPTATSKDELAATFTNSTFFTNDTHVKNGKRNYYNNDYLRWYFVPDYQKPVNSVEEANAQGSDATRFVRFIKLGRYDTDESGNEVFKSLEYHTIDEISKVFGFEYVFIQFYSTVVDEKGKETQKAYTAPVYYRELNKDTYVSPGSEATHFRLVKAPILEDVASVFNCNFCYNMVNIPWAPHKGKRFTRQWNATNKIYAYMSKFQGDYTEGAYDKASPKETMIGNDYYYGFYLNYGSIDEPKMKDCRDQFILSNTNPNTITWLPLTGAYNPTKGISFKTEDDKTIRVEAGSSITVNSFLWTNSTITRTNKNTNENTIYPGGIALHGAEARGDHWTYYGQHIHSLSADDVQADRHYTAAVRCVKDIKKVTWDDINFLTSSVELPAGGTAYITLKSVNGSWKMLDPGAPWLLVTPDKGEANGGNASNNITLKVKAGTAVGSRTTISFQIEGESTMRKCTVKVVAE